MSAPIKPDMLCWIIRCQTDPKWIGRVVKTVAWSDERQVWAVTADWLPPPPWGIYWTAKSSSLKPLHDPDLDVTDRTDALHDNLLEFLATRYAPTEAA